MATQEVHLNDIGTALRVTIEEDGAALDISTATTKQILLVKPSMTKLTKTAVFVTDGTDGVIEYVTIAGDLDELGNYSIQGYIVMTGWTGHSEVKQFKVYRNL